VPPTLCPDSGCSGDAGPPEADQRAGAEDSGRGSGAPSTRNTNAHRGVPGSLLCRNDPPVRWRAPHNCEPGNPRRQRPGASLPARHEAAGARAAWSLTFPPPPMTTLLGRRWAAGGGPEGRGSGEPGARDILCVAKCLRVFPGASWVIATVEPIEARETGELYGSPSDFSILRWVKSAFYHEASSRIATPEINDSEAGPEGRRLQRKERAPHRLPVAPEQPGGDHAGRRPRRWTRSGSDSDAEASSDSRLTTYDLRKNAGPEGPAIRLIERFA